MRMTLLVLALAAGAASAQQIDGARQLVLANAQGERVAIGTVKFEPRGQGRWRFVLALDPARFEERFLAMRPFRCLTGPRQQLCHFPYGEDDEITRDDLTALEYRLMFLHKKPAAVNVDGRNGIYYRLRWDGDALAGTLYDVDMDPVIVPQGDRRRPITPEHLLPADAASHWLPQLRIE